MEKNHQASATKWTWADLHSSYRFWGLVFYFVFIASSQYILSIYSALYMKQSSGLSYSTIGVAFSFQQAGFLFGVILAWIASRMKSYYLLYLFSAFYLLGIALFCFNVENVVALMAGEMLIGLGIGAIILIIPAFIAGAVGSTETYVLAFGLMATLKLLNNLSIAPLAGWVFDMDLLLGNPTYFFAVLATPAIIGTLLLMPMKPQLFNVAPPVRQAAPLAPTYREPGITFLLYFVPFYNIYWLVKIHAEIRNYSQSATLLTPRGAGWSAFVVPIVTPAIFSTLNDTLRAIIESHGQQARYKTWLIILFAFLLPPVSAALIQSQMNEISGNLANKETQS
ncbi:MULTISPECIES: MFS transporter [Serratia]|uniref:MFS transporter n=1 Tax=Serratia TaxID=613 RepID=UPI000E0EEB9F|nr:MFS transporter [Serratia fonticola]RDL26659.1 hypothetical protein DFO62_10366 [Serratia fonticola]